MAGEKEYLTLVGVSLPKVPKVDLDCWDPKLGAMVERIMCKKDLKEVQIIPLVHQMIKIGTLLVEEE